MRSRKIVIPGRPQGKGRPRFTKLGHAYTPEKTRQYEELIRVCWMEQADGWVAREGAVGIIVMAYYPIPTATSKERRSGMLSGRIRPTVKADADNVLKVVLDSLNKYAWSDDKQIVEASIQKLYGDDARVEVVLYDV